jgi:hypothetical protein
MVDLRTGQRIGAVLEGVSNRVDISGHLAASQPGQAYVHLYTHPASTSFSDHDGATFAAHAGIRILAVIGIDGTWYLLTKGVAAEPAAPAEVLLAFRAEVVVLRPKYQALVRSKSMTAEQAWRAMTDEIWQSIAPRLGLRYHRIDVLQGTADR